MSTVLAAFRLLLSSIYPGSLAPEHLADLRKSGLTDETIQLHRIRSIPPAMISQLLGFDIPAVRSAYLIPFPDPAGGFMDHVRMKMFPSFKDKHGNTVRYLQPRGSGVRLFFPLLTLEEALHGKCALWLVEGEKKSLAVAQLGLPAVGFSGIQGWHLARSRDLLPDFDALALAERTVELVPDSDVHTNPHVDQGALCLARALRARGARVRLVVLPAQIQAA